MGKVVGEIAAIAVGAALIATGVGAAFGGATIGAVLIGGAEIVGGALAVGSGLLGLINGSTATPTALVLTFDPDAPRKMVLGYGPMAADIVYDEQSSSGGNQFIDYIVAVAAHTITSIDEVWSDGALMWLSDVGLATIEAIAAAIGSTAATEAGIAGISATGIQGVFKDYTTIDFRLCGTSANAIPINGGTTWTSACTLTGCAYLHLRVQTTGKASPFSGGVSSSIRIVGKGMPLYDPRRDSTNGGSGSHRPGDQTTWEYSCAADGVELGQNHALHALAVKLGWAVGGVTSVGAGIAVDRIDLADYITAANQCDEPVADGAGGTQRRYEGGGLLGDDATPAANLDTLCTHMNATLRDTNGKLGIRIAGNDLAGPLPAFTDADVLGAFTWVQYPDLAATPSEVRGKFSDPSLASLWQLAPYTYEQVTPPDGVRRPKPLDLPFCHDAIRAQRIARQVLRRGLIAGRFTADFGPRGWGVKVGDPVTLTFAPAGLSNVVFRVAQQTRKVVLTDGVAAAFCPLVLVTDDPYVTTWDGIAEAPAAAVPAVQYDPRTNPLQIAVATATAAQAATNTSLLIGQSYTAGFTAVTFTVVGGASVTATLPAHDRVYPDKTVAVDAATITGLGFATTYCFYYDDAARAGGAETMVATTNPDDAFLSAANPYRHDLGYGTTPAADGSGGDGSGGGSSPRGGRGGPIP